MVGTLSFGIGLRDTSLIIIFYTGISTFPVGYLSAWNPKTGIRQLAQARFSFGCTGISVAMDRQTSNPAVCIIIIAFLYLLISFCGFKILHLGKHLKEQFEVPPPTAPVVLSFRGLVASFMLPWVAWLMVFPRICIRRGLAFLTVLLMTLGAVITNSVSGILAAMIHPAGGFVLFVTVILALSLEDSPLNPKLPNAPHHLFCIPHTIFSIITIIIIITTSIVIGVAISAANPFFINLENFIGVIATANFNSYIEDGHAWDDSKKLPLGFSVIGEAGSSWDVAYLIYRSDCREGWGCGFESSFIVSALLNAQLRYLERKIFGR
ncbi:uncharacterized protein BDR25DRAFT_368289 [Lindgomyces ingoldianus]|uniref:Uncharacterized protein n=1 Tax=Lindgomyces ingoldianus TaxID=673940 RepID=A0ACB6QWP0_9PLEO|nr:uncharacterized protein BDR25DRAFT_368289 [Lindgomyces ingoldianus]KAF2471444.1 hypothetical protein BDR25DRAFT_368289 [Lindgomyces ingoldianus]